MARPKRSNGSGGGRRPGPCCVLWLASFCVLSVACGDDDAPVDASVASDGGSRGDAAVSGRRDAGRTEVPDDGAPPAVGELRPVEFPLHVSRNRRYLVDRAGQPFLINQAASWGLVQSLSTADARSYLDGLVARGWNSVLVSVISNDARMPGEPPAWQGIDPFTRRWDFSTANPEYFEHADEVFELARERGLLLNVVPCYLGFVDDATQGWADELLGEANDVDKSRAYGRFLGARYRRFDNLVWVAGGDQEPARGSRLEAHMRAIVDGIREADPDHLWTAHWDGLGEGSYASENPSFADVIDLDGYYAFNHDLTYRKDLAAYARTPTRPLFHLDMSYETEEGGSPSNIRRKAYSGVLSGAFGSSFNAGPSWYLFENWRRVDSQGSIETTHWYRLFASRPWYELVPDTDHAAVSDDYGSFGSTGYVSAAHTSDWRLVVAYLPEGSRITVDLGRLSATRVRAYWYDPSTGRAREPEEHAAEGTHTFNAPSSDSWVLLVEDAALDWRPPGTLMPRGAAALPWQTGEL
ncbi:MAG: DUF4038 domain-containing protein [Polyangiales bacterium]